MNKNFKNFEDAIVKSDVAKKVTGGYDNEGLETGTCKGTNKPTGGWPFSSPDNYSDFEGDGDFYSSC
ncbi:hypothetical protein [Roseivirga pacifica]|uniref:hypothetical protein n=1 Tax=Roseivirga pacifica TaxID=1267423 RepID=UPI00227B5625|nr:hypothetical protein [Roseivirga pacifica]